MLLPIHPNAITIDIAVESLLKDFAGGSPVGTPLPEIVSNLAGHRATACSRSAAFDKWVGLTNTVQSNDRTKTVPCTRRVFVLDCLLTYAGILEDLDRVCCNRVSSLSTALHYIYIRALRACAALGHTQYLKEERKMDTAISADSASRARSTWDRVVWSCESRSHRILRMLSR
jgi:hypothetical protein